MLRHSSLFALVLGICLSPFAFSQIPDQNIEAQRVGGASIVEWYAHSGRTYFLQATPDLGPVQTWVWMDVIEVGNDVLISHEFGSTAPQCFVRLHYIDAVPPAGVSPEDWDADDDGLTNQQELVEFQTHPLDEDTDDDGTLDGVEAAQGDDPKDPASGGTPVVGKVESSWAWLSMHDKQIDAGGQITIFKEPNSTDSDDGNWVPAQNEFQNAASSQTQDDLATNMANFPLPTAWKDEIKGLW
ncbi:MAG: hypothetical protein AAGI48_08910 [Verrucomicrobiota bacterium]